MTGLFGDRGFLCVTNKIQFKEGGYNTNGIYPRLGGHHPIRAGRLDSGASDRGGRANLRLVSGPRGVARGSRHPQDAGGLELYP